MKIEIEKYGDIGVKWRFGVGIDNLGIDIDFGKITIYLWWR